jgi:hypothetical protein
VVLDVDRHPADARIERQTLGNGPRDEDARDFEPKVVVEPARAVPLDDEPAGADRPGGSRCPSRRRLRCLRKVALAPVFLERHEIEFDASALITC